MKVINKLKRKILEFNELRGIKSDYGYNLIVKKQIEKYPEAFKKIIPEYEYYVSNLSSPEMAISLELANFLLAICFQNKPRKIVDLGSGFSSFIFRIYQKQIQEDQIEIFSVDDNENWINVTKNYLIKNQLSDTNVLNLETFIKLAILETFDLVLLDLNFVEIRKNYISYSIDLLNNQGVLIIDDVHKIEFLREVKKISNKKNKGLVNIKSVVLDKYGRFPIILR